MSSRARKQKSRVQRIDSPDGRSSIFMAAAEPESNQHAREALDATYEMHVAIGRDILRRKGLDAVPGAEEVLRRMAAKFRDELERKTRQQGIAPHLLRLLDALSKREAERLAAKMVVTAEEFSSLVGNARTQLGYRHRMKWKEFRPDQHSAYSDEISKALRDAKPGPASPEMIKAMRKMQAMFEERKRVHAHMFERGAKWHCFFFDLNDMTDPDRGPHIHYISHRWPVDRETVWADFDQRRQSIPRAVHVRYADRRLERAALDRSQPRRKTTSGHILRVDRPPESDEDQ